MGCRRGKTEEAGEATGLASSVVVQESFQVGKAVVVGISDPMGEEQAGVRCLPEASILIAAVGQAC